MFLILHFISKSRIKKVIETESKICSIFREKHLEGINKRFPKSYISKPLNTILIRYK